MMWVILLAALGITLLSLEIIIPGGILGAIGGACILGGCVVSFVEFGATGGLISTVIIFALTGLIIWLEFRLVSKTSLRKRAFLDKSVDAVSAAYDEGAKELIGKSAEAVTTLAPSGYISINGRRYEAFCESGLIESGAALKVVGADSFRLIVASASPDSGENM